MSVHCLANIFEIISHMNESNHQYHHWSLLDPTCKNILRKDQDIFIIKAPLMQCFGSFVMFEENFMPGLFFLRCSIIQSHVIQHSTVFFSGGLSERPHCMSFVIALGVSAFLLELRHCHCFCSRLGSLSMMTFVRSTTTPTIRNTMTWHLTILTSRRFQMISPLHLPGRLSKPRSTSS
jgi:hypothetical protein